MPAGKEEVLRCESRGGNPAPIISWFIDNSEVKSESVQNGINAFVKLLIVKKTTFYFLNSWPHKPQSM